MTTHGQPDITTLHSVTRLVTPIAERKRCQTCQGVPWWVVSYTAVRQDVRRLHRRTYCHGCLPESCKEAIGVTT